MAFGESRSRRDAAFIGSVLSLATAVAGAVGFRSPGDGSAMRSREANPLARVQRDRGPYPLGVAMCVVAAIGPVTGLTGDVAPSTVVGLLLPGYAVLGLGRAAQRAPVRGA